MGAATIGQVHMWELFKDQLTRAEVRHVPTREEEQEWQSKGTLEGKFGLKRNGEHLQGLGRSNLGNTVG